MTQFVPGCVAAEAGDTMRAAREMEAFGAAYKDPIVATNSPGYNCWIAPAEEAAGHPDKADAVLKSGGSFMDCYRFRAYIFDGRHDWAAAQSSYAQAVALASHGDLAGAIARFKQANEHGPHWADPLKAWGDALMR